MVLDGSLLSRAKGCLRWGAVVEVHAVGYVLEATDDAGLLHLGEELVLAVEAAVAVVALIGGVFEFAGVEDVGGDVVLGGEGECGGEFGTGEGGGVGDDGEHIVAEGLIGGVGKVCGVGAAGVGDEDRSEVAKCGLEERGFGGQIHLFLIVREWVDLVRFEEVG